MLREYEKTVVRILASSVLSPQQIDAVILEGEFVEYDYTGEQASLLSNLREPLKRSVRWLATTGECY